MNNRTLIIAEAGVNHNGSVVMAKQLVDAAIEAGADIVKFQAGAPKNVTSKFAEKAKYQKENTKNANESQLDMLKKINLTYSEHTEIIQYCKERGMEYLCTPFDLEAVDYLHNYLNIWKIPSGEITNYPYLKKIASYHQPVILSTGMCTVEDIAACLKVLTDNGLTKDQITILHCNTEYPTPFEDVNLRAMQTIADTFGVKIGYSDHTRGIEVPIAAVALGATVIEKHFTLDRTLPGPDHIASLEPDELKAMVSSIRNIEKALGSAEKKVSDSERKNIAIARKSIVAARNINKGETLTEENITVKRPGTGISPMKWNEVIGTKAIRDFSEDELIEI